MAEHYFYVDGWSRADRVDIGIYTDYRVLETRVFCEVGPVEDTLAFRHLVELV